MNLYRIVISDACLNIRDVITLRWWPRAYDRNGFMLVTCWETRNFRSIYNGNDWMNCVLFCVDFLSTDEDLSKIVMVTCWFVGWFVIEKLV